ncbi:LysR family transcriptional regulator [Paracandidimonas soli]|nr:LysR family transcriptional regulator [Paracandidimonas soli]
MEAFIMVARSRSITVAAEKLFLSQGAVSRQILDLEKFVGVSLFSRGSKGLELTTAGQQLAAKIQPVLSQLEEVFASLKSPGRETLNISAMPSFGLEIISPAVNDFLQRNPQYLINFLTTVGDVNLEEEEFDAAIVLGEPRSRDGNPELLCTPSYFPYISADLAPCNQAVDHSVLYQHKLIGQLRHPDAWPEYFEQLGLVFSPDMVGGNHSMLTTSAQAVLQGTGVALLPEYIVHKYVMDGKVRRICDTPYLPRCSSYYLVSKKSVRERLIFLEFRSWLMQLCSALDSARPARHL